MDYFRKYWTETLIKSNFQQIKIDYFTKNSTESYLHTLTWPFVWVIVIWDNPLSKILSLQAIIKVSWVENSCSGLRVHFCKYNRGNGFSRYQLRGKGTRRFPDVNSWIAEKKAINLLVNLYCLSLLSHNEFIFRDIVAL